MKKILTLKLHIISPLINTIHNKEKQMARSNQNIIIDYVDKNITVNKSQRQILCSVI